MRYINYFEEVLNGFIPLDKPMILQRVILSGLPDVEGGEINYSDSDEELDSSEKKRKHAQVICSPYIQVFKNGQLAF